MSTQRNNYFYFDDYMYFSFNNIHSSKYNLVIQNDIEDLKLNTDTGAKLDFSSAKYQEGQYYLGVTRPQKSIPLKVVGKELTRAQTIEIAQWLRIGTTGALIFDFAEDWAYDVVVSSLLDFNLYEQEPDTYIVSFEVKFATINSVYARNRYDAAVSSSAVNPTQNEGTETATVSETETQTDTVYSYNNNLVLPACALIRTDAKQYTLRIFHLGNHHAEIEVDLTYPKPVTAEDVSIKIEKQELFSSSASSLSFEVNLNTGADSSIIRYSSASNLFFINNNLPQQEHQMGRLSLPPKCVYNVTPIDLKAPGPITVITQDNKSSLLNTSYNTFVCKVGKYDYDTEYFANNEDGTTFNPYPSTVSDMDLELDPSNPDNQIDLTNYEGSYFGFYTDAKITCSYDNPSFEVYVRQYQEVI